MIQSYTAYTFEIDDPGAAAAEIVQQIDVQKLRAHSLGILTCYPDFIETGAAKAVSDALPFDVIGCTTAGTAVTGELGELMLSLMVLTSDDVHFSAAFSGSLAEEQEAPIEAAYRKAAEGKTGKPAMILAIAPFIQKVGGEAIVEALDRISGKLPVFGTVANDASMDFSQCETFFNGESSGEALAFALLYGDIHPQFCISAIPEEKTQKKRGVITKSKGNLLMEVNNMPLVEYLKTLGLYKDSRLLEITAFPFSLDYNDGTSPVARSIFVISEDGCASCGGFMPENATLALGSLDYYDVLRGTSETMDAILKKKDGACIMVFACFSRYLRMGVHTTAEMETIRETVNARGSGKDYQFAYSGGEICPVYSGDGTLINRFHNCSVVACAL